MTRIDTPTGLEDGSIDLWTIEDRARDARAAACAELLRAAAGWLADRLHHLGHHPDPTARA